MMTQIQYEKNQMYRKFLTVYLVFVVSFIFFVIFPDFWLKSTKKTKDFHALSLYHRK